MAYHLHVVDGKTILVDARADFNQDNIRKFANKYFFGTEDGIVHCGKGHFFGAGSLFYYNIQSIEHGLVVVSWGKPMMPSATTSIARNYVGREY